MKCLHLLSMAEDDLCQRQSIKSSHLHKPFSAIDRKQNHAKNCFDVVSLKYTREASHVCQTRKSHMRHTDHVMGSGKWGHISLTRFKLMNQNQNQNQNPLLTSLYTHNKYMAYVNSSEM